MSPLILAIDTTTEFGSIALVRGAAVLAELALDAPAGYGQVLFDEISLLLGQHKLALSDIDCFASANGPGTFTGVRVGLATVKGLAYALSKPICAVSNLEAIASMGTKPLRAVFLDARRGDVFGAIFDAELNLLEQEVVTPLPRWIESLPKTEIELMTTSTTVYEALPITKVSDRLAVQIGRIAAQRFPAGKYSSPEAIDANYVRRADAESSWVDR